MKDEKITNTAQKEKDRSAAKPNEIRARLKFLRMGPRKVRLITNFVCGMNVAQALDQLRVLQKIAREPIVKLIQSAVANAKHNFGIEKDNLFIKKFIVNQGPTLKRWKPKAYGRAGMIRKRTCHVELTLESHATAAKKEHTKVQPKEEIKILSPDELKRETKTDKGRSGETEGKKTQGKGFTKRLFSRKTG